MGLLASEDPDDENNLEDEIHSIGTVSGRVTWEDVREASHDDSLAQMLKKWIEGGLVGDRPSLHSDLKPFWRYKQHLAVKDGVVLYLGRIFIPPSLRGIILKTLHSSHQARQGCYCELKEVCSGQECCRT